MAILADANSTILIQGITGREATTFARESLAYGARVVAGTSPGKGSSEVHGIPVYNCVRDALCEHKIDVSVISVPPAFTKDAALESIYNGIKLITILTERVPQRDTAEIICNADQMGARVIGPNSMGLICPGKTKIGLVGGPASDVRKAYQPGPIGIASRSGGMTTELANLLTNHGLGQSACVSVGGDTIVGMTFVDLLALFDADPETKALVIFCEPGGSQEEALAEYVKKNQVKLPIVAFIAGRFVDNRPGQRFGHAGTIVERGMGTTREKSRLLREAGITVADKLSDVPNFLERCL